MRSLAIAFLLVGCSRSSLLERAENRLDVTGPHLVLVNEDMHGEQYFMFCRDVRAPDDRTAGAIGAHPFADPACVVYWCPSGDDVSCSER